MRPTWCAAYSCSAGGSSGRCAKRASLGPSRESRDEPSGCAALQQQRGAARGSDETGLATREESKCQADGADGDGCADQRGRPRLRTAQRTATRSAAGSFTLLGDDARFGLAGGFLDERVRPLRPAAKLGKRPTVPPMPRRASTTRRLASSGAHAVPRGRAHGRRMGSPRRDWQHLKHRTAALRPPVDERSEYGVQGYRRIMDRVCPANHSAAPRGASCPPLWCMVIVTSRGAHGFADHRTCAGHGRLSSITIGGALQVQSRIVRPPSSPCTPRQRVVAPR